MNSKIMIIERNQVFLKWVEDILASAGYDVCGFSDENLSDNIFYTYPDLCLLSFDKKEKNDFILIKELIESHYNHIPVVAVAPYDNQNEFKTFIESSGIKSYLLKPFMPLDLISKVEKLI